MTGALITITVKPRSTRAGVEVASDGSVIVRVHAPAAEGAANKELLATFAAAIGVPKSHVHIVRGEKSRTKHLAVDDLRADEIQARLHPSKA